MNTYNARKQALLAVRDYVKAAAGSGGSGDTGGGNLTRKVLVEGTDYTQATADYARNLNIPKTELSSSDHSTYFPIQEDAVADSFFSVYMYREPYVNDFENYTFDNLVPDSLEVMVSGRDIVGGDAWKKAVSITDGEVVDGRPSKNINIDYQTVSGSTIQIALTSVTFYRLQLQGDIHLSVTTFNEEGDSSAWINEVYVRFNTEPFIYPQIIGKAATITLVKPITSLDAFTGLGVFKSLRSPYGYDESEEPRATAVSLPVFSGTAKGPLFISLRSIDDLVDSYYSPMRLGYLEPVDSTHFKVVLLDENIGSGYDDGSYSEWKITELIKTEVVEQ